MSFFHVDQVVEGVDLGALASGPAGANGDHGSVRVRAYYGRDENGLQRLSVVDDVYGHEQDVTSAELARAMA